MGQRLFLFLCIIIMSTPISLQLCGRGHPPEGCGGVLTVHGGGEQNNLHCAGPEGGRGTSAVPACA